MYHQPSRRDILTMIAAGSITARVAFAADPTPASPFQFGGL